MKKLYSKNTTVIIITVIIILFSSNKSNHSDHGFSNGAGTIQAGGSINFSPGFVTASNGTTYTGNVSVSAHYLDPSDPNFSAYTQGDLKAAGANNPQGALQSFGVVVVEMDGASGNKLQLAAGKKAIITLPTTLQDKAPV